MRSADYRVLQDGVIFLKMSRSVWTNYSDVAKKCWYDDDVYNSCDDSDEVIITMNLMVVMVVVFIYILRFVMIILEL